MKPLTKEYFKTKEDSDLIKSIFYKTITDEEKSFVTEFMNLCEFYIGENKPDAFTFSKAYKDAKRHHNVSLAKENLMFLCYFWEYGERYFDFLSGECKDTGHGDSEISVSAHAARRMKERLKINKKSAYRQALRAVKKGYSLDNGNLDNYTKSVLGEISSKSHDYGHMGRDDVKVYLYSQGVYIFKKLENTLLLVTAYGLRTDKWNRIQKAQSA